MNLHDRRLIVDAFIKSAAPVAKTTLPGPQAPPAVAGVVRKKGIPRTVEGPAPVAPAGPAKGMTPQMNLKTTAPTSLNVSASAIREQLEKLSETKPAPIAAALDTLIAKMANCGMMHGKKKKNKKMRGYSKIAGVHGVARDATSNATQKPTAPGVEKLESASDEPPKKAPEKKPEPKPSENEAKTTKEAAGRPTIFPVRKRPRGLRTRAPRKKQTPIEMGPPRRAADIATQFGPEKPISDIWPYLISGGLVLPAAYGASKALNPDFPAPTAMPADPQVSRMMRRMQPSYLNQAGDFLGNVGGRSMSGVGDLLGGLGFKGAQSSLAGWSQDPTISKIVGGGEIGLGTILAIALIRRLLGGGSED